MMQTVVGASALASGVAMAADLPMVALTDPMAKTLGYAEDTAKVDAKKFPKHTSAKLTCDTCALYQGKAGEAAGPCPLFAGKRVTAKGWCNSYAPKKA